jgi:carboxymethylenebutenolidase
LTAAAAHLHAAPGPEHLSFPSGGSQIAADRYAPAPGPVAAPVIVLHGAGGLIFDGPDMRRMARFLAGAGHPVYLVHYFNRNGAIVAWDGLMQRHFDEWLGAVRDGIAWVHAREGGRPVDIYGYSLGAFLAVASSSDNPDVGAIVEQAGGIWNSQEQRIGKMPPVLMVHGLADKRVPFQKYAVPLLRVLKERGGRVETDFVPGEGHTFKEPSLTPVREKTARFFNSGTGIAQSKSRQP